MSKYNYSSQEKKSATRFKLLKKRTAASLVTACAMMPIISYAQSNVTVYGQVDTGIEYVTNANKTSRSVTQVTSGLIYGSSIGFKGTEDLGGGLNAIFRLEAGFGVDTGASQQGGRLFGRQSWVGLANENNRVLLGRVYTPMYDTFAYALDPLIGSNVSVLTMDGGMVSRADKSVRYTRTDGPWHQNIQYSFGSDSISAPVNGVAGGGAQTKELTLTTDYTTQQLVVAFLYDDMHGPLTGGQYGMGLYVPSLVPAASITPQRAQRVAAALRYTWGDTSFYAGYRHLKTTIQESRGNNSNLYWTGLMQRFTPVWNGAVGVYHERVAGIDARPTLVALQTQYQLSKRTSLYANLGKIWNTKLSNMGIDIQTQTLPGASQVAASIGMFHFF